MASRVAIVVAVVLAFGPAASAQDDDPALGLDPGEVADLMTEAAPSTDLADLAADTSGDLVATNPAGTEVAVSDEGDGASVSLTDTGVDMTIGLPFSDGAELSQAGDTAVLDATGSVDLAVQTTSTGVRIATVLADASAPTEYPYTFEGTVPVLLADGSVELTIDTSGSGTTVVGTVASPWATDANGAPVTTYYRVEGNTLVQVVAPSPETAFPVVADPSVSFGWYIYVNYSASEVKTAMTGWRGVLNDKSKYAAGLCAIIPNAVGATFCGLITYDIAVSVIGTYKSALAVKKGVELSFLYNGLLVGWKVK